MFLNRMADQLQAYVELLEKSEEVHALSRDLLIGVSSFFRDPGMFRLFADKYLPELLKENNHQELRIWIAGCATGEEAYSYAIELLDYMRLHD